MNYVKKTLKDLDTYWFGWTTPEALAVFRILVGIVAAISVGVLFMQRYDWFTEQGYVPLSVSNTWAPAISKSFTLFGYPMQLPRDVSRFDLLQGVVNPNLTSAFIAAIFFSAILTALGLFTRFSSILLAAGIVTLHHRNPILLHGGDSAIRLAAIYLAVAPCGRIYSLDWLLRPTKRAESLQAISIWPQRLIQIQMAIIYFTTVWHKAGGDTWKNGTATWYPARLAEFHRFPVPDFINRPPMTVVSTYGTLFTELALATLVFSKSYRKWVLLAGIAMHFYIDYSMNIPLFSFIMCSYYVCFYEGDEVRAWVDRLKSRLQRKPSPVQAAA